MLTEYATLLGFYLASAAVLTGIAVQQGASAGVGRAAVRKFARHGARSLRTSSRRDQRERDDFSARCNIEKAIARSCPTGWLPELVARLGRDIGLISAWFFCFDRGVLAKDNGGSLSTVGPTAARKNGAVTFATTHWSLVLTAQGESPAAHEALEKLCRTYWRPLYAFVRQQGYKHEEAEDLTQSFFALLLERRDFDALRAEKGKLRSYLLVSLKHFLSDERQRGMALKRGKGQPLIPLEDLRTCAQANFEPSDPETAEWIYERRWALALLNQVFSQLGEEYRRAGKAALFDWLKQLLPDEPGAPSQAEIAATMGMTENAVNQAFYRFRQRYQFLLREEIAHTVARPKDVEDELQHLISILRA